MTEEPQTAAETLIEVRDLAKHYGSIRAVDGVSFSVRRGDLLAFLGPNGAGKTTAMQMVTGFLEPDRGSVRIAGRELTDDPLGARRRIGYLPESAPAYGEMTVLGFLRFIAAARELPRPERAIDRVCEMTELGTVRGQTIETLSKGFKRRVGLAQALIHDPEILVLDEPTDGLDPNQKAMIQELLSSLSADKSILVSTHILDEAERICNRVAIISEGRILVDSTPSELIERAPNHNVLRVNLADEVPAELTARLEQLPWCERVVAFAVNSIDIYPVAGEDHLRELLAVLGELPVQGIHLQEGRLDELFRSITKGVAA